MKIGVKNREGKMERVNWRRHEDWILKQCHIWKIWCQQKSNVQIPKWYFAVKWQPDAGKWLPIAQCTIHSIYLHWRDILITLSRPLHSNEFPYLCAPKQHSNERTLKMYNILLIRWTIDKERSRTPGRRQRQRDRMSDKEKQRTIISHSEN